MMFGKAVVLALWVAIIGGWSAFKKRRAEAGLPLKKNRRTGVYQVDDWPEKVDRTFRFGRNTLFAVLYAWWAFLLYYWITGQTEELGRIINWLFF